MPLSPSHASRAACQSLRVYARSAFVEGGAFNEAPSMWGRHATDFIPEPVSEGGGRAAHMAPAGRSIE